MFTIFAQLLLHHVIPGAFQLSSLQDEMTGVSLAGTQLRVNTYNTQDVEWNDVQVRPRRTVCYACRKRCPGKWWFLELLRSCHCPFCQIWNLRQQNNVLSAPTTSSQINTERKFCTSPQKSLPLLIICPTRAMCLAYLMLLI